MLFCLDNKPVKIKTICLPIKTFDSYISVFAYIYFSYVIYIYIYIYIYINIYLGENYFEV